MQLMAISVRAGAIWTIIVAFRPRWTLRLPHRDIKIAVRLRFLYHIMTQLTLGKGIFSYGSADPGRDISLWLG
jgi:hypothetical protein